VKDKKKRKNEYVGSTDMITVMEENVKEQPENKMTRRSMQEPSYLLDLLARVGIKTTLLEIAATISNKIVEAIVAVGPNVASAFPPCRKKNKIQLFPLERNPLLPTRSHSHSLSLLLLLLLLLLLPPNI
jgi:hypothetical protein